MSRALSSAPSVLTETKLRKLRERLLTRCFGKHVFFSREVGSTNEWARELAEKGAEEGTVTLVQMQTAGRGRLGREWISPRGGLWFSLILRPNQKARQAAKLVFVASLAVAEVLHQKYGLRTETKWPNDVLANGRKICGILAEMNTKGEYVNYVILGVGLNADFSVSDSLPELLKPDAASIESELGRKIQLENLLKALLEKMEEVYYSFLETGFPPVLDRWKLYAGFLGKLIVVREQHQSLKGVASDVDVDGALIMKLEDGTTRRILVGDVAFAKRQLNQIE